MNQHQPPKYLAAIAAEAAKAVRQPGLYHVTILHDDWCQQLAGKGPCNCNPIVEPAVSHRQRNAEELRA